MDQTINKNNVDINSKKVVRKKPLTILPTPEQIENA
jgi:hypothetical protein